MSGYLQDFDLTRFNILRLIHLTVATVAVYRVTGKWLWNIGGWEFPRFRTVCCVVVAMQARAQLQGVER